MNFFIALLYNDNKNVHGGLLSMKDNDNQNIGLLILLTLAIIVGAVVLFFIKGSSPFANSPSTQRQEYEHQKALARQKYGTAKKETSQASSSQSQAKETSSNVNSSIQSITYTSYIVKAGDTLSAIANQYNTTIATILELNNLTSNSISVGQALKVPSN